MREEGRGLREGGEGVREEGVEGRMRGVRKEGVEGGVVREGVREEGRKSVDTSSAGI